MMVPNYSSRLDYDRGYGLGVTQFGQMTAGSYCYIGPQGIVHGTTLVVLNAGRKYLQSSDLGGKVLSAGVFFFRFSFSLMGLFVNFSISRFCLL
jgi:urocanate hydratase